MKTAVIVFPGSNCDRDVADAVTSVSGTRPEMVWHRDSELRPVDLILLPGGFSYGDYLRAGAMAAHSPIMREVAAAAGKGVPVLGICNGFQMLTETRLLPGVLMRNAGLKFVCRQVHLRVETSQSRFTSQYTKGQIIRLPVAHLDGNYFADSATLARLEDSDQVAFRYVSADGLDADNSNPNGSIANIAGIFNESKSILGLMPHPDRAMDRLQGGTDGRAMFEGLLDALQ
ncbi:MAG: phosphoribosylformylglycinamidine synthase subunit PurQ [Pirellulaceae bacterium]|nr:phosphoribosylformylglycinamidine synthase subunit PurQ [Pirellulaceae bacterium]